MWSIQLQRRMYAFERVIHQNVEHNGFPLFFQMLKKSLSPLFFQMLKKSVSP
jgi:hypothetical protein